jgi:hypothetical protein
MNQLPLAISFVVSPGALVLRTIGPHLSTLTVTLVVQPLPCVNGTVLEMNRALLNSTIRICIFGARA